MMNNANELADVIRQNINKYKQERIKEIEKDIQEYKDKRNNDIKMIIKQQRLIKDMIIVNGDDIMDKFISYMDNIKPLSISSSSFTHFIKVDIPDVSRKILNEVNRDYSFKYNNNLIIERINNKIVKTIQDIELSKGVDKNITDSMIREINLNNNKRIDKDINVTRINLLNNIVSQFDTLWLTINHHNNHTTIKHSVDDDLANQAADISRHDSFFKIIEKYLNKREHNDDIEQQQTSVIDNKVIPNVINSAAAEYRKSSDKLKIDNINHYAKGCVVVYKAKKDYHEILPITNKLKDMMIILNIRPSFTTKLHRVNDIKDNLKSMVANRLTKNIRLNDIIIEHNDDIYEHEWRYKLTSVLMDTLIDIRQAALLSYKGIMVINNKSKANKGIGKNNIPTTTQALHYSLSLLKASIMWRVKLAINMLWEIYNNSCNIDCRKVIGSEFERVVLEEENRQYLRITTRRRRSTLLIDDDDNNDDDQN